MTLMTGDPPLVIWFTWGTAPLPGVLKSNLLSLSLLQRLSIVLLLPPLRHCVGYANY